MHKKFILYLITISFLITSCGGNDWAAIKRGVTGAKSNDTDEFLVKKKDPLVLPPKYGELPLPKSKGEESQDASIKKMLGSSEEQGSDSKSTSNLENMILKELRKNN